MRTAVPFRAVVLLAVSPLIAALKSQSAGRAGLTDIVMPFHLKQADNVVENLETWKAYPPCAPTIAAPGAARSNETSATITLFVSSAPDEALEGRLLAAFADLPVEARACIREARVRFGNFTAEQDHYLNGSRLQFEYMLQGHLGLASPHYILYMEPDCMPIRANWLAILDETTRAPSLPFWIKGSIYRGDPGHFNNFRPYNLFHLNGNAIYNLHDKRFALFYFEKVRSYITKYYGISAYDTDIFKFLIDPANYNIVRPIAHMFQFTDVIQNYWHTDYSLAQITGSSTDVVLVHGGHARQ